MDQIDVQPIFVSVTTQTADKTILTSGSQGSIRKLVLFDFDGTITTKDTLIEFVHFYRGKNNYRVGMVKLAPIMALYGLRLIPNWKAKQFFLTRFFKGEKLADFNRKCINFSTVVLPSLIRADAQKAIDKYRSEDATVAVVSASAENWVKPWCDKNGIICLATQLDVHDGIITGKLKGRNCYGDEKACRIREQFNLAEFNRVIAYGDSAGDREMLALAHEQHYKPFR